MTDMRATERLLEVIEEKAEALYLLGEEFRRTYDEVEPILEAVRELSRRGDTLVRADDIRAVIEATNIPGFWNGKDAADALDRLENALGGKMR